MGVELSPTLEFKFYLGVGTFFLFTAMAFFFGLNYLEIVEVLWEYTTIYNIWGQIYREKFPKEVWFTKQMYGPPRRR